MSNKTSDLDRLFAGDMSDGVKASMVAVQQGLVGQATVVCDCGTPKTYECGEYFCPLCDNALC